MGNATLLNAKWIITDFGTKQLAWERDRAMYALRNVIQQEM